MRRTRFIVALIGACVIGAVFGAQAQAVTTSFVATGAEQTFVVPAGITSVQVFAVGGKGGNGAASGATPIPAGGFGAVATGTIAVTPGQTLFVNVGGQGGTATATPGAGAAFNGGGAGGSGGNAAPACNGGGGGGGASDVRTVSRTQPLTLESRLVVAGGGGGGGGSSFNGGSAGGSGGAGGANGANGANGATADGGAGGAGATANAPGGNGTFDVGGDGESGQAATCSGGGGGGGGGAFGGGGGADAGLTNAPGGGGGGGSSAFAPNVTGTAVAADATGVPAVHLVYGAGASNAFTFGAVTKDKKKGTATQAVTVPSAGKITLAGTGVKQQTITAAAAGTFGVEIKATGNKRKKLNKKGKVKVTASFTFAPAGGTATTQTTTIKLKRKR